MLLWFWFLGNLSYFYWWRKFGILGVKWLTFWIVFVKLLEGFDRKFCFQVGVLGEWAFMYCFSMVGWIFHEKRYAICSFFSFYFIFWHLKFFQWMLILFRDNNDQIWDINSPLAWWWNKPLPHKFLYKPFSCICLTAKEWISHKV